ncbi:uncharacterized protein LOC122506172 [Leptopilina heterotoma]|uniref:uncharacterized protein LOC122506172 n=1 Tax=Leptopilina heterotoma TaxID=63436 RepID=UPI001CA94737|nr:uncharacterized protein LOC122506172 [Leptopilina heterotoma]
MFISTPSDPISAVQMIPVINYLNLLSDFLFLENRLSEYDQYKPIPIVNGLYQYFEDHRSNQTLILKLIRNLLLGSDLYGEKENENIDAVFVNAMFDYIISSLVFAKYGNIYGFLIDSIRQEGDLQLDSILERIKQNLKKAEFENEYGNSSTLTELSVSRIFNDLLMPLFPQPPNDIDLLSLDYIFAQAGSTFFRLGRLNYAEYYKPKIFSVNNHENLFDEYLTLAHVLENLHYHKLINPFTLKSFALPALFHYVTMEENLKTVSVTKIIFEPFHWERAYDGLFQYIKDASAKIENQLANDYTYKMHRAFSVFQSRAAMAKFILDLSCERLDDIEPKSEMRTYLEYRKEYKCNKGGVLEKIDNWFKDQLHNIGEVYEKYDLGMTQQIFNESFLDDFRGVVIKLLIPDSKAIDKSFNNSEYFSYDLLEFYDNNNQYSDYYALLRENYTVTLISEYDEPALFHQLIGPSIEDIIHNSDRIILKYANESIQQLSEELMKYKKARFKSYLNHSDNSPEQTKWWKEFGLSLVPHYPCFSQITNYRDATERLCDKDDIKFLNKHTSNISSQITHNATKKLLSNLGTTIETVFIKDIIERNVIDLLVSNNRSVWFPTDYDINKGKIYQEFATKILEPTFEIYSFDELEIKLLLTIIDGLEDKVTKWFSHIQTMLNNMKLLKNTNPLKIYDIDNKSNQTLFVNTWNQNNGFGYKFVHYLNHTNFQVSAAKLRTDFKSKEKIFIVPRQNSKGIYIKFNNQLHDNRDKIIFITSDLEVILLNIRNGTRDLVPDNGTNDIIYEINNQLWNDNVNVTFYRISYHDHNDELCNSDYYLQKTKHEKICSRHWRYIEKTDHDRTIIKNVLKNKYDKNNLLENEIRNILRMYTFPNDTTLIYFLNNWLQDKQFKNSDWSRKNILDSSGLLNKIIYDVRLENKGISITDGEIRINSIYTYKERTEIEEQRTLENIINDYNNQKEDYSVMFEDYYAIYNFVTNNYKISFDTREGKMMRNALYKLAIRQYDDQLEEFDSKLFYFESVSFDIFNRIFYQRDKIFTLQKCLLMSINEKSALRFAAQSNLGYKNILYEMKFFGPYLRAKIDVSVGNESEVFGEKRIIIFPGSEFHIDRMAIGPFKEIGNYLKVVLTFKYHNDQNYELFNFNFIKEIMRK